MIINVKTTGMEVDKKVRDYAEEKVNSLTKFFDNILKVDVEIGMDSQHHQKGKVFYAEFNVHVPRRIVRVARHAESLTKAIDKVKDHLKVELERMKGKRRTKDREGLREQKSYQI